MTLYRFTLAGGNEYGASFELRLAVSAIKDGSVIGSKQMPTVAIQNGTAVDTVDPVTTAVLDSLIASGVGAIGRGVTIARGVSGSRTVDYDAAALAKRQEIDAADKPKEDEPADGIAAAEAAKEP